VKVAGLFAGIGGFEFGLTRAGHETELLCEIAESARAVLRIRFDAIDCYPDIRNLRSLPAGIQVLTAGFPCQDLSQAGTTDGINGARSGLVRQIFRLLDQQLVEWVVLENVSFMLHLHRGKALGVIVEALEERGYRWAYRVINSLAFVPQRRERVFLVATRSDVDPARVLFADEEIIEQQQTNLDWQAHGFYWTEGNRGLGWAPDAVPTLKVGSGFGIPAPPAILMPDGSVITPDIRDAERLQGFPPDWTKPAEDVARPSVRWALVGNAVTVPVAGWLGRRLSEPGDYDRARDRTLDHKSRWPTSARFDGKLRWKVEISNLPSWQQRAPLAEFLRYEGRALSARATRGFLSRAEMSTLRFVEGFKARLRAHLDYMERRTSGHGNTESSCSRPDYILAQSDAAPQTLRPQAQRTDVQGSAAGDRC
jgi:DNA (cytosine-5)-methyltransferase 1